MVWIASFWKVNFVISLITIQFFLCIHLKKKPLSLLKWSLFTAMELTLSLLVLGDWEVEGIIDLRELINDKVWTYFIGGMTVIQMWVSYEAKLWNFVYLYVTSYCLQKMEFSLFMIVENILSLYFSQTGNPNSRIMIYVFLLIVFCALIFVFLLKSIDDKEYLNFDKKKTTVIALIILLSEDVIDAYMFISDTHYHVGGTLIVSRIYSIFFNIVVLAMLFNLIGKKVLQTEKNVLEAMLDKRNEQYSFSKAMIDAINIKSHDLKKQINYLKHQEKSKGFILDEIENTITSYDAIVNTENITLSTVLTEKSIQCKNRNISFSCIADGGSMGFMSEIDIYTLFANMLDNAIEATMKLPEQKRSISIIVKTQDQFLSIREENYYNGVRKLKDGRLITTKDKVLNHGFGTKSMGLIVDKYEGDLTIRLTEDTFKLNILIPIP